MPALFERCTERRPSDHGEVYQVIQLHVAAPAKPLEGQPCNGCGVCCASETCPLGILVSTRTRGACSALEWKEELGMYRCGLVDTPATHLPPALKWTAPVVRRLARRQISAGSGCDCSLSPETADTLV